MESLEITTVPGNPITLGAQFAKSALYRKGQHPSLCIQLTVTPRNRLKLLGKGTEKTGPRCLSGEFSMTFTSFSLPAYATAFLFIEMERSPMLSMAAT